ncbi:hypothetical protein HY483_03880 [Candidatus Woesearchaeota archaeon]|nr:hypothetical protein [Candidatus Woesearchaeota archaeon]
MSTVLRSCSLQSNGCYSWVEQTCGSYCSNGACYGSTTCTPGFIGVKSCDGNNVVQNYRTGVVSSNQCVEESRIVESCSNGCSTGSCIIVQQCTPPKVLINGVCSDSVIQCSPPKILQNGVCVTSTSNTTRIDCSTKTGSDKYSCYFDNRLCRKSPLPPSTSSLHNCFASVAG